MRKEEAMTTALERSQLGREAHKLEAAWQRPLSWLISTAGVGLALWALAASAGGSAGEVVRDALIVAWGLAGIVLVVRRPAEPLGLLVALAAVIAALGSLADPLGRVAVALLPAVAMHVLLGMPTGALKTRGRRILTAGGYAVGIGCALALAAAGSDFPRWVVGGEIASAALIGGVGFAARYTHAGALESCRMKWVGWAVTVAGGIAVVVLGLSVLVDWPTHVGEIAAGATLFVPVALVLGISRRLNSAIDRMLTYTISLAGLTAVVVAVYLAIVLGLGRVPHKEERTLLVLSMVAAAVAALLYLPAHSRLKGLATRLVYGEQRAPDEVLRTFGSRMSRSIPLEELLLQMAESLRKTLGLRRAEVWRASPGSLELAVSDPEQEVRRIALTAEEESTITRTGVSGPAWIKVWLPGLLTGREEATIRVAPTTYSGELLGLIVVEREPQAEQFSQEDERILTELARQVGLTLHNVRLDSALQASLDEVRRQAEALQASRTRIVAAADAERRRIERNLHDGAQQHLVALAVKVRLAQQLANRDMAKANAVLDELGGDLEDALQELRDLAHGIYPPLLADKGLAEALASAARRAVIPTEVRATDLGRYSPEMEAAIYFCCLEALQNSAKHAGEEARATIRLWEEEGGLLFEVADDGAGFDVRHQGVSGGFTSMNDRLGAIGGSLRVESAPGRGTKVAGVIPLQARAEARE
jgi:signal transduction histidine kinase